MEGSLKINSAEHKSHKSRNKVALHWVFFKELKSIRVQENKCLKKDSGVTSHLNFCTLSLLIQTPAPVNIKIFRSSGSRLQLFPSHGHTESIVINGTISPEKNLKTQGVTPSYRIKEKETTSKPAGKAETPARHNPPPLRPRGDA